MTDLGLPIFSLCGTDASMDALLRPLANHADRNVTIMDNVIICLYSFGTSAIDTDETLERLQTILGPDLEDSTTEALNTAIDMMSYFRGIDDRRVRDFYAAMVAAVPRVCLPNDEEEEEEELEEEGDEEEEEDDTLVDGADGESQETDESDNNGPFIALGQQDDISSLGSRSREPWPIRNNERVAAALNDDASDAEDEGTSSAFDVDGQQSI